MDWIIYDIEVFVNFFYVLCRNVSKGITFSYEISSIKDERKELLGYLNNTNQLMIGFNTLKFDWPLLNHFEDLMKRYPNMPIDVLNNNLKKKANQLIKSSFVHPNNKILQLDLLKLNHYDNLSRICSLKILEFNMRMDNVQELPYEHTAILTEDEMEVVRTYCENDIQATINLCKLSYQMIHDRFNTSKLFNTNTLNYNDSKIGEFTAKYYIGKELNTDTFGQSIYEYIDLKDIIFDYISFETEPFKRILEFFKQQRITNDLKGVFNKIPFENLELLDGYYLRKEVKTREDKTPKQDDLNILYKGCKIVYGVGGAHFSVDKQIIEANNEYIIIDVDVGSYYPSLAICNRFYPNHLSEKYCDVLEQKKKERSLIPKSDPQSDNIKKMLNSCFGKSNEDNSFLFDKAYFLKTTLNGQLLLSKLIEKICENTDSVLLQYNTDGASFYTNRLDENKVLDICKQWEIYTKGLTLEIVYYSKMILQNVNNYIWISTTGKIKKKGAYTTHPELHKNHSKLIVPKAVEAFYLYNTPVEEFIRNHTDIFDFFLRTKLNKDSSLIGIGNDEIIELPRLTRYLVTNTGYTLLKLMSEDRRFNIEKDYLCTPCNYLNEQIKKDLFTNINYEFYIDKANKLLIGEDVEDD
jgi:hypothetical protein